MGVLVLVGLLVLVVGGLVCVVWASRGGPRWVPRVYARDLNESVGASACKCPGCCSMKPRLGFYGVVAVCAVAKGRTSSLRELWREAPRPRRRLRRFLKRE